MIHRQQRHESRDAGRAAFVLVMTLPGLREQNLLKFITPLEQYRRLRAFEIIQPKYGLMQY